MDTAVNISQVYGQSKAFWQGRFDALERQLKLGHLTISEYVGVCAQRHQIRMILRKFD